MTRNTLALPRLVSWYWMMGAAAVASAYLLAGAEAGRSALWGAAVVAFPNTLFALWLMIRGRLPGAEVAFFWGEAFKVVAVLVLAWGVTRLEPQLNWLPFILGMALTAKAGWIGLLTTFGRNHGGICCRTDGI